MSEKKIASVGCQIPGNYSEYIDINSDASLLDWDIILFLPQIYSLAGSLHDSYLGKPSLSDSYSFQLKNRLDHWRREITDALHSGKTVIFFLSELYEVFIDTGQRQYSGTGRNRQTTRIVSPYDNYKCLPIDLEPINSKGSDMKLAKGGEILSSYWSEFKDNSSYEVRINSKVTKPLVITRTGEKTLGALVKLKETLGNLLLLPYIDLDAEEFSKENKKGESLWTKDGQQFGARLLNAIVEIDKALRSSSAMTPTPEWANSSEYDLPKESQIREEIFDVSNKIEALQQKKRELQDKLVGEGMLRGLLFEKGHPLEDVILLALNLIGFSADKYKDSESEFDVVFKSVEGRFLGEAEGKDSSAIGIDKLRQLEMNIHEDLEREEVLEPAKSVLFGNAYRLSPMNTRGGFFTEKCLTAAKRSNTALVRTPDLFLVAQYLSEEVNEAYAAECRKAILETKGEIVRFPERPTSAISKTDVVTTQGGEKLSEKE